MPRAPPTFHDHPEFMARYYTMNEKTGNWVKRDGKVGRDLIRAAQHAANREFYDMFCVEFKQPTSAKPDPFQVQQVTIVREEQGSCDAGRTQ